MFRVRGKWVLVAVFLAVLWGVGPSPARAQEPEDDQGQGQYVIAGEEGVVERPLRPVGLAANVGFVWYFPEPARDVYKEFFFEPAVAYGAHFSYTFWDNLGVVLGVLTATARLRAHEQTENLGIHTDVLAHDIRLGVRYFYPFLDGVIRPFVVVGPSLLVMDMNGWFENVVAPGGGASAGIAFFFDDLIGLEARGGFSHFFAQDDFDFIQSWNLYGSIVFAF